MKLKKQNYEKKINYKFDTIPTNIKCKLDITTTNTIAGWNDIFEIFVSYQDNKEYLVSPNSTNFNLDIFVLIENQKIKSIQGHNSDVRTIRYFINEKDKNEYLISADSEQKIIIFDITNDYQIKYKINTEYVQETYIYSCLLIFPNNINNNYIITSASNRTRNNDFPIKIFSFNDGKFIRDIRNKNKSQIYYLLSWYNKINDKYYIIQFTKKIIINNIFENELYAELIKEPESYHLTGFICHENNKDYLYSSSINDFINIWDLYEKNLYKIINTKESKLIQIIDWNKQYFIGVEHNQKNIKIINKESGDKFDINNKHEKELICLKKINHPKYGESLFIASQDNTIKLWTVENSNT